FIAKWPGRIKAGAYNHDDYISGVDFTATVLEALGLQDALKTDGRSYLSLLLGEKQEDRDTVFTQFNTTAMKNAYPMRCIQSRQFGYIFNGWADGETFYKNESMTGLTYKAMKAAETEDEEIANRVQFFNYRCREEFYDFSKDSDALTNLINDPEYQNIIQEYRERLYCFMRETEDPQLASFKDIVFRNTTENIE
ncbi:MAG: sulfatase, partial [Clostridiaceae bacterium]|nr:sulfatase [Clostridiaceae bacterium]